MAQANNIVNFSLQQATRKTEECLRSYPTSPINNSMCNLYGLYFPDKKCLTAVSLLNIIDNLI